MSTKDTATLSWEWPADRSPEKAVLATVTRITMQDANAIGNSPSMTAHLPEPMLLDAKAISGAFHEGTPLSLRLPKMELGEVSAGDMVAIGLVEEDICICIEKAPVNLDEQALAQWFSNWSCQ